MFINNYKGQNPNEEKITFKKVNIIIGKNNSGKSYLMRNIMKEHIVENYFFFWKKEVLEANPELDNSKFSSYLFFELPQKIERFRQYLSTETFNKYSATFIIKMKETEKHFFCRIDEEEYLLEILNEIKQAVEQTEEDELINAFNNIINEYIERRASFPKWAPPSYYYSATRNHLFELNNLDEEIKNYYFNNYSSAEMRNLFIKTGQDLSKDLQNLANENPKRFGEYKLKLAKLLNFNNIDFEFVRENNKLNIILNINGIKKQFNEVGDGIQSLIVLSAGIDRGENTANKVFIEEPENNLHPGLQRELIKNLISNFNSQIFITTHSPHFLDLYFDTEMKDYISIIKVEENKAQNIEPLFYDLSENIGCKPSSLMLSNCIIWVEGPSDANYIEALINLYIKAKNQKSFERGINYNFAYTGGIKIAQHFNYDIKKIKTPNKVILNNISKNNFFVFDFDGEDTFSKNSEKYFNYIKEEFKNNSQYHNRIYIMENVYTIENIIPQTYLKRFFKENFGGSRERKNIILNYLRKIELSGIDIANTSIIELLSKEICAQETNPPQKCERGNYTVSFNKVKFSVFFEQQIKKVIDEAAEIEQVYESCNIKLKDMIEKIYDYIEENNN